MKRLIALEIDCAEDGVRCGGCKGPDAPMQGYDMECAWRYGRYPEWFRGPLCLAAEQRLARLVESGERMRTRIGSWFTPGREPEEIKAWDAALAALKGER